MAALLSPTHVINRTMHILGPRGIGITTNIHYYRILSNYLCYAFSSIVQLLTTSEIPLWNSKSSNCLSDNTLVPTSYYSETSKYRTLSVGEMSSAVWRCPFRKVVLHLYYTYCDIIISKY